MKLKKWLDSVMYGSSMDYMDGRENLRTTVQERGFQLRGPCMVTGPRPLHGPVPRTHEKEHMARPKVPILTPTRIADAALDLVEQTGDLQMVQLAKHLGVAPSSPYGHVGGRAEVVDLARLRMLEQLEPQGPRSSTGARVSRGCSGLSPRATPGTSACSH
jgi:hypothetical protein